MVLELILFSFTDEDKKLTYGARVAFQVRIQPGSYEKGRKTVREKDIDALVSDNELEWFTKRRGVVIPVGLLIKVNFYHGLSLG